MRFETLALLVAASMPGISAELKPDTVERWNEYIRAVDARNQRPLFPGSSFLSSDDIPEQTAKLRNGQLVVSPGDPHVPLAVTSGLIHDWIGAAFIPNVTLQEVLATVRDYDRYQEFFRPSVMNPKLITAGESRDSFSMILMNRSVVSKTALETEYVTTYTRVDDHRWYSITNATHIREIAQYGTASQHTLPENHGTGFIWRLHTFTRYEERDGGVYLETEAVALSRDIPGALRWFVEPIVRRVSGNSMTTSLRQTQAAVRTHSALIGGGAQPGLSGGQ
jgi:hypothetical protein